MIFQLPNPTSPVTPLHVLDDDLSYVREEAAFALGQIGDEIACMHLVKNLTDWHSNKEVAKALEQLNWKPNSDTDMIHYFVALRNGTVLILLCHINNEGNLVRFEK